MNTCDEENVCNDFFCKLNNHKNNKCPITFIMNKKKISEKYKRDINLSIAWEPFFFSKDYEQYQYYDSNYNGLIGLPLTDIVIGRTRNCKKTTKFTTVSSHE